MDTGAYLHSVFGLEGKTILVTGAARRPAAASLGIRYPVLTARTPHLAMRDAALAFLKVL